MRPSFIHDLCIVSEVIVFDHYTKGRVPSSVFPDPCAALHFAVFIFVHAPMSANLVQPFAIRVFSWCRWVDLHARRFWQIYFASIVGVERFDLGPFALLAFILIDTRLFLFDPIIVPRL